MGLDELFFQGQMQQGPLRFCVPDDEKGHSDLRQARSPGRPAYAPAADGDEDDVEDDVDDRRQDDGEKGRPAVADGPQQGRIEIIDSQKGYAEQDDAQVLARKLGDVRRRAEGVEKGFLPDTAGGGTEGAGRDEEDEKGRQDAGQRLVLFFAVFLGG